MSEINYDDQIPEDDRDFLKEKGYDYEIVPHSGNLHVILRNFDFPEQYEPRKSDLLIIMPGGYPNAALDTWKSHPVVKLKNGADAAATGGRETLHGREWQAWSRHMVWRVGKDNLRSFIAATRKELDRGL